MAGKKTLKVIIRELNVGVHTIEEFLKSKGIEIKAKPTTKVSDEVFNMLLEEFDTDRKLRNKIDQAAQAHKEELKKAKEASKTEKAEEEQPAKEPRKEPEIKVAPKIVGKIDLDKDKKKKEEEKKKTEAKQEAIKTETEQPAGTTPSEPGKPAEQETIENIETKVPEKPKLKVLGTVDIPDSDTRPKIKVKTKKEKEQEEAKKKRKRKRISRPKKTDTKPRIKKEEPSEEEIKRQIKETLEKLQGGQKKKAKRLKRERKKEKLEKIKKEQERLEKTLNVTEFISVSELAGLMDVEANDLIEIGFKDLGTILTPNSRLDAETIQLLAAEYGYDVEFTDVDEVADTEEVEDDPAKLKPRPPVVTIMGHVDHGKTSLLDYIRKTNIVAGEAGGITQHIGAYNVTLPDGRKITFLDTPGHEAFTAMRARGAQVTDLAVIIIAADDKVNQQTKEAINHAVAAGVPIVFAINKIDKPNADPEKIKGELAQMNFLVEDWGGKYQSQDISAKTGEGVEDLLEKILLETELMELKANPDRPASGTVLEASLEKGKGYTANVLVQNGTLKVGDYVVAGRNHGKVRAMYDERGNRIKEAGPSVPVKITGLDGAPRAGDKFKVYLDEKEAKKIAQKRDQIYREQQLHSRRHITLDEIGRRLALGDFKQLNLIIKGDVDGSVEALSDSLTKLSNENVEVRIIHKGVGQISEADVNLAAASDAVIIGFNVRPSGNAARLAQEEGVQIKTYSIIYDAIDDVKNAIENMLSPVEREQVTGTAEVRQTFKISRIGTVAGCMVTDGKIYNKSKVRVIRDGIVIHEGELSSLKRFKDDVKEVAKGYECGLTIKNFNDIKEGDVIEAFDVIVERQKL
jgi:translation initiation factor IF-2